MTINSIRHYLISMKDKNYCPICGKPMHLIYGCGWDYDRWICDDRDCPGEIETDETTYPEGEK